MSAQREGCFWSQIATLVIPPSALARPIPFWIASVERATAMTVNTALV
jgi:hypothetical protein